MEPSPLLPLAALIGLDWGNDHHDVALMASSSQVTGASTVEPCRLAHEPAALAAWLATLAHRFGGAAVGAAVGIAIETSRGPVVHALLEAPFVVLYPVNPRSLARFREAFVPNGAKDDGPDARLLLELLVKHRALLRPWHPDDAATRSLARLVQFRRATVDLRTQLTLQLQAALTEYFPQALRWAGDDLATPLACEFLERWPTLQVLQRARPATIRQFYTKHNCRSMALIAARVAEIATATPLTQDPAILASSALYVQVLVRQLLALGPSLTQLDEAIAQGFAAHPDAALFTAVPGAGAALAPRLLVAFGTERTRFPTAADLQTSAGIAPGSHRSPSAVANNVGSIGAGPRPPFCARPSSSSPTNPSGSAPGPAPSIINSATAARPIRPPCAAWRSSGFAFCGAAGRTTSPTMTRAMNARWPNAAPHSPPTSTPRSPSPNRRSNFLLTDYLR